MKDNNAISQMTDSHMTISRLGISFTLVSYDINMIFYIGTMCHTVCSCWGPFLFNKSRIRAFMFNELIKNP